MFIVFAILCGRDFELRDLEEMTGCPVSGSLGGPNDAQLFLRCTRRKMHTFPRIRNNMVQNMLLASISNPLVFSYRTQVCIFPRVIYYVARAYVFFFSREFLSPLLNGLAYPTPVLNLRPGGGGHFGPPPLWFFEDNSKTKGSSITKLGIPFH